MEEEDNEGVESEGDSGRNWGEVQTYTAGSRKDIHIFMILVEPYLFPRYCEWKWKPGFECNSFDLYDYIALIAIVH